MANKPVLKATDFASDQQTRTFLNWSIYELSTAFERRLFAMRNRFSALKTIPAPKLTQVAKYLGEAGIRYRIARLARAPNQISIKSSVVEKQFPGIPERVSKIIADELSKTITEMENQCHHCGADCLSRPAEFCVFFEQKPDKNALVSMPLKKE